MKPADPETRTFSGSVAHGVVGLPWSFVGWSSLLRAAIFAARRLTSSRVSCGPKAKRYQRRYFGIQSLSWNVESPNCRSSQIVGSSATGRRRRRALAVSSSPISKPLRLWMPTSRMNSVE